MPIPDFQTVMLPLLESLADGKERLMRDVTAQLADRFELSDEERQQKLPSGESQRVERLYCRKRVHPEGSMQ